MREKVVEKFAVRTNVIVERHCFNMMIQDLDENISNFTKRLKEQAVKCKFVATVGDNTVDLSEEFVRDRIVVGLKDNTARGRLLREKDLTLTQALELVSNIEIADEHVRRLTEGNAKVHAIRSKSRTSKNDTVHVRKPQIDNNRSESVSAMNMSLPGTYMSLRLYLCNLSNNLCILAGHS